MKKLLLTCLAASMVTLSGCKKEETLTITNHAEIISTAADMSEYRWIQEPYAEYRKISFDELNAFFDKKASGILYLGYDGCPYCERAIVELNEVCRKYNITVYYAELDPYVSEDEFMTEEQYHILTDEDHIGSILMDGEGGEKALYVPLVIGVKDGKITGSFTSLVDNFEITSDDAQMSDAQKKEQQKIYTDIIRKTAD